ncbi:spore germination protein [Metasolibacillus meyeri]|uniref:Spore germination protein n=1 Tax=Metasolibacillus meyeri TaxID=1071052 RepID=A0AAW9NMM2_9BACL|nr:spore germination protein [Metasolibacillus meyeri]MEC1177230.1 spore germination protein [Metasolibacillus meyeri]
MKTILQELTSKFSHNSDFIVEEELIDNTTVYLIGFQTLVDMTKSKLYIQQIAASSISVKAFFTNISNQLNVNTEQLTKALLDGYLVILSKDETKNAIVNPIPQTLGSGIGEPNNESPIQASIDAFGDDINVNVGMLRKRLNTERLCLCSYEAGELSKRKIYMLYIKDKAPNDLIEKMDQQLTAIQCDIETLDDLNRQFGHRKWSPVSHLSVTELPIQAMHALKNNRVVLFMDYFPFALIFPNLIFDMFKMANDGNFPYVLLLMLRTLRIIGIVATLLLPALYVALVSINPEIFKIDLALFVIKSREGIPLSAFLETIVMVILIDLILEAIVRLPKSIGPAITMVGGIILGQSMVEAELVSNLLIITITGFVIASSAIVGLQNSFYLRLLKYPILLLASIFGILGICVGFIMIIVYLASLTSNGIPYTTFHLGKKGESK